VFSGAWSSCTASCGTGSQSRSGTVVAHAAGGGCACPYLEETQACNHGACPIHCATSAFGAWSTCTKSCGDGAQSRSRSVTAVAANGGYACPYLEETRGCNAAACAVDCFVTEYTAWSACTTSCGAEGSQERTRSNSTAVAYGGVECPSLREARCWNVLE
jgi:hypothetical protein